MTDDVEPDLVATPHFVEAHDENTEFFQSPVNQSEQECALKVEVTVVGITAGSNSLNRIVREPDLE